jgi:glycoside hydrolase-like protein
VVVGAHRRYGSATTCRRTLKRKEAVMAMQGLSTNRRCEASASCLFDAGRRFVVRYHSRTTAQAEKRLHPREAAELARAGLDIACVYQDHARELEDFGAQRGEQDAVSALTYAGQVGQPPGSAVYFAVDSDFSAAQIRFAVVPYFQSVGRVFARAGGGTRYLEIGVYGSGLTCHLIGQLPFVRFTWLAGSTGWRESSTFGGWHLKQHVNGGQALCALDTHYEDCESTPAFGQFKPVGFDVLAGRGEQRVVTAGGGHLRHLPSTQFNQPITLLPQGHAGRVLGQSGDGWLRVRTSLGGSDVIGHVAASRLEAVGTPLNDAPPVAAAALPIAHLRQNNPNANRRTTSGRAFPIGELPRPARDSAASAAVRVGQLQALADWLGVESSQRYARTPTQTFCNVYAADYCHLADAYLPRVWWTDSALLRIGAGEQVPVLYGDTVREMRADDLFAWLCDIGPRFGWRRVFDATALQDAANAGGVGLICADRAAEGRPGHVTVVVPEDAAHHAARDADGHVTQPLQSQAGAVNRRFGSVGDHWWMGSEFRDRGFFTHR